MPIHRYRSSVEGGIVNLIETFNFADRKSQNGCGSIDLKVWLLYRLRRDVMGEMNLITEL